MVLSTPVAFLIFNRPDTTAKVFEEIRRARPPKLLVVADGPRTGRPDDAKNCAAARDIINLVDWPCEVMTNYADVNMGCKRRVSSGLDWVFNTVEEAIILEDDCLPDLSFFWFCEELLERYREDERIMMISGTNLINGVKIDHDSYFYSKYPHIWGWASWSRAWKHYDVDMNKWPELRESDFLFDRGISKDEKRFWVNCFDRVFQGDLDTWDAQVTFMSFCQHGLTIFPHKNLVKNIGFGLDATHTRGRNWQADLPLYELAFPLRHPEIMSPHVKADDNRRRLEYSRGNIFVRIVGKISRILIATGRKRR